MGGARRDAKTRRADGHGGWANRADEKPVRGEIGADADRQPVVAEWNGNDMRRALAVDGVDSNLLKGGANAPGVLSHGIAPPRLDACDAQPFARGSGLRG